MFQKDVKFVCDGCRVTAREAADAYADELRKELGLA